MPARAEVVFDAWLDPEALADFMGPAPTRVGRVECDARVGGALRIDMVDDDGVNDAAVVHITGQYLEIDRPRRLRFTWASTYAGGFESVVTVTFEPRGDDETMMTIDHAQVPPQWRDDHERGWGIIAAQLQRHLSRAA
ncbi:MAG TPA: SRPBCC domain-containing protein [Acidimicrobiales bacterium]|nr:SRPBCC domain-containing protein [Acidimicrobiales bacterium]